MNPLSGALRFLESVQGRKDEQSRQQQQQQHLGQQKPQGESQDERNKRRRSAEELQGEVQAAVDEFEAELHTQAADLHATMIGQGPGLRVILKDGSGGVVRQLTGEEFLKLRETAGRDTRVRGKILDQKL